MTNPETEHIEVAHGHSFDLRLAAHLATILRDNLWYPTYQ